MYILKRLTLLPALLLIAGCCTEKQTSAETDIGILIKAWAYYGEKDPVSPFVLTPRNSYSEYSNFNFRLKEKNQFDYTVWGLGPWTVYGSQWNLEKNKNNELILNMRFANLHNEKIHHRKFKILTLQENRLVIEEISL